MKNINLETIHKDLTVLKREIYELKIILISEPELREDIVKRINEARKRVKTTFVAHKQIKKEFMNQ
jgi:hypothetical protein